MIPESAGFVPPPREVRWGGEHPGLPRQSAGGAERGRGQAEVGAGSRRAGNCTARAFGVPSALRGRGGHPGLGPCPKASQPPSQGCRGLGGELAGKQRGSTSRGAAGTLQGPSRVGATPKTLPRGLCPAPQLPWGRARVNHPGDASRPASLLAQPDLHPQRGARPRHTSRSGPALLLQPR